MASDKQLKIGYWVTTGLVGLGFVGGGVMDLLATPDVVAQFTGLGYPAYLPRFLGVAKLLGAVAILGPKMPRLKEWAYAGVTFDLMGAAYSHIAHGDGPDKILPPVVLLAIAAASYLLRPVPVESCPTRPMPERRPAGALMPRVVPLVLLVGLGAAGACVRTRAPAGEPPVAGDDEQAVLPSLAGEADASLARDPCMDRDGLVIDRLEPILSDWQGGVTVSGHGPVVVRWCGTGAVTVVSVTVSSPEGAQLIRELDPKAGRLESKRSLIVEVSAAPRAQWLEVVALANDDEGRSHRASAPLESVEDPERVTQRSACEAAGGSWGPQGMLGHESCDRPTRDAGQRCTASADCESFCIEDGHEALVGAPPEGVEVPQCSAGQQPRLLVGHCYERSQPFGCHPRLRGVTIECIAPGAARRGHMLCVD